MKTGMVQFMKFKALFAVLVFILPAILPLLRAGLPPTHDGEYHVIRFYEFFQAIQEGSIYPRWAGDLNNGYGIPLFNYVYPLPNYMAALLHYLGISFIDSFKFNLLAATVTGSVFFYLWSRKYWGDLGGFISAIAYSYAPYRFVDIYVRGSVGEVWALAFLPAIFWSLNRLEKRRQGIFVAITAVLLAALVFSHNILAVMFSFVITLYACLLLWRAGNRKGFALQMFLSGVLGAGLSAVFWFPALTEIKYVRGLEIFTTLRHFVDLYQLLIPSWGTGFSGGDMQNQMSFQIGIIPLAIVFVTPLLIFWFRNKRIQLSSILLFYFWFMLSVFLMLRSSSALWASVPLLGYFQFPWRFLSLVIVCTSFLSGALVNLTARRRLNLVFTCIFVLATISLTAGYTQPAYYHDRNDDYYTTRSNFISGTNSPGDAFNTLWMGKAEPAKQKLVFIKGTGKIVTVNDNITYKKFLVGSHGNNVLKASVAYFPGWTVFQDGSRQPMSHTAEGLLTFPVAEGKHIIEIIFLDTIERAAGSLVTYFSVSGILIYLIWKRIKELVTGC